MPMHGGLLCITFCHSVISVIGQKIRLDMNREECYLNMYCALNLKSVLQYCVNPNPVVKKIHMWKCGVRVDPDNDSRQTLCE